MRHQKDTELNAEYREPLGIERVQRPNMLSSTAYVAEHKGVRSTSTLLTRCLFQATLRQNESDGSSTLTADNTTHNYAASEDVAAHAAARTYSDEQLLTAKKQCKNDIQPKSILTTLRQTNPSCKAILQDVYNIKTTAKFLLVAYRWMLFWTW